MEKGKRDDELVDALQEETGLSDAAVRSVLWQVTRRGWRVVRLHDTALLEADGRPVPTVTWAVAEEWTP